MRIWKQCFRNFENFEKLSAGGVWPPDLSEEHHTYTSTDWCFIEVPHRLEILFSQQKNSLVFEGESILRDDARSRLEN